MLKVNKHTSRNTLFWAAIISVWGCFLASGWYLIGSIIENQSAATEATVTIEQPLYKDLNMMPASGLDDVFSPQKKP